MCRHFIKTTVVVLATLFGPFAALPQDSDDFKDKQYSEIGVNLGLPAGVNLLAGQWFGRMGLSVSGMYLSTVHGAQANIGYKLFDTGKSRGSISLIGGFSQINDNDDKKDKEWKYAGAAYNWVYRWFWLEAGLSLGRGDFSNPQLVLQVGFIKRVF